MRGIARRDGQLIRRAHPRGNWVCFADPPLVSTREQQAIPRIAGAGREAANADNLAGILRLKRAARVMISPGNYWAAQLPGLRACFCPSPYLDSVAMACGPQPFLVLQNH